MIANIIYAVAIAIWGAHLYWRWRQTRLFAPQVLATRKAEGEIPEHVTEEEFTDLYVRSEGPRAATYIFVCAAFMGVFIGPLVSMINAVWRALWRMQGSSPVFEVGTLIHTFSVFLILMGLTILLLSIAMRRYYAVMPPNFKQVMRDLNGGKS